MPHSALFHTRKQSHPLYFIAFVAGLLLSLHIVFSVQALASTPKMLEIHFMSIGQGDGILLRTPSGKNVLIDVGPPGAGKRIIGPYLRKLGIKKINLLMISHPHFDHYGGWKSVVRNFRVKAFVDPGFPTSNRSYHRMMRKVRQRGIKIFTVKRHQILDLGGGARLRVLWPARRYLRHTRSDANSNSIVARLEYRTLRVMLTGDAEEITEKRLLHATQYLPSHVLKVAHHGSKHSSSSHFLKAVQPKLAVISCAKSNVYRHPHPHTLQRLRRAGIPTFVTGWHGHVILRSNGKHMWLSTQGKGRQEAIQSMALKPIRPIQALAHQKTAHPLHIKPERKGWINVRAQGRKTYRSGRITPSQGGYVASRRSKVFHRKTCRFARIIRKRNRVYYKTRQHALRRGKRPASDCRP